jgi:hypothetical protein
MSLPLPVLDNRTFDQLVSEGTAQISRLSPSWTDYNASDPGITLVELFAWLSEQNLYRADRVPAEMVRAFLRLVDITPKPAQVARTVILLATTATGLTLPDRVQIGDTAGTVTFETTGPLTVSRARLVQVLAGRDPLVDVTAANAQPYDAAADPVAGSLLPFGDTGACGDALYLGFDMPLGLAGTPVSLHVWTISPIADDATRAALIAAWEVGRAAAERDCPAELAGLVRDWRRHYAVRTVWEFRAADGTWHPLADVEDETRALTLSGFVRFTAPAGHAQGGPGAGWFIRCRVVCGSFDCATRLDLVGINAVLAEHAASIDKPELLGTSAGHAGEIYATARTPVVPGSTHLTLTQGLQQDARWTETLEWDLVGAHDRRYRLEPARGRISIGNGFRGAVLSADWQVSANYRVGGGVAGNIASDTLTQLAPTGWNAARIAGFSGIASAVGATQPIAAAHGADAETLPAAEARAVVALTVPTRAVTLVDVAALACAVPGVPVAHAAAFPNMHPAVPCFTAPGSITVVVVPDCPGPAPVPGADFLREVARYLDRRRPVTTELHVIAPTYVTITVAATLQAAVKAGVAQLQLLAQQALDQLFNPLNGGPNRTGWPIGRSVYRTEVMTTLAALPSVFTVTGLTLQADGGTPVCGNVSLCATDLVRSGQHQIAVIATGTTMFSRSR